MNKKHKASLELIWINKYILFPFYPRHLQYKFSISIVKSTDTHPLYKAESTNHA